MYDSAEWVEHIDATSGELRLSVRKQLIVSIAEQLPDQRQFSIFCGVLNLTCAKHSWPVWNAQFPDDQTPMDLAEAFAVAQEQSADLRALRDQLYVSLQDKLLLGPQYFAATYAGWACWAVCRDRFPLIYPRYAASQNSDLDVEPEGWETCFFSSLALSGGAVWEEATSAVDRNTFWLWFLQEAIPNAMASVRL